MTRRQKLILVILGILDITVIALLASVVIRNLPPTPTTSPIVVHVSYCEQKMAKTFSATAPFDNGTPSVAWNAAQGHLSLNINYTTPTPPEDSAQLLWTALDTIAEVVQSDCPLPETVTISINARGTDRTHQFLTQLAGADIESWLAGNLTEEALATQARYRKIVTPQ